MRRGRASEIRRWSVRTDEQVDLLFREQVALEAETLEAIEEATAVLGELRNVLGHIHKIWAAEVALRNVRPHDSRTDIKVGKN